jgi:hypothetical protein
MAWVKNTSWLAKVQEIRGKYKNFRDITACIMDITIEAAVLLPADVPEMEK